MALTLTPSEEAQVTQTIEMFEVITQSQPNDYQSLEILKEAYAKLGKDDDAVKTSKRIAQAYVQMGQLSSAILEYETILQRCPDDPDIQEALKQIETKANSFPAQTPLPADSNETQILTKTAVQASNGGLKIAEKQAPRDVDDGRRAMRKIYVDGKIVTAADFDLCWTTPDLKAPPTAVIEPFIQVLADKGIFPVEASIKILSDRSRAAYLPMDRYDIDLDLARSFKAETCRRWCVLPFDKMSKSIFVATANPFNQQAAAELAEATHHRLLWYLISPQDLIKNLRKAFR
jgi:tetratricopeptide (TPR) repeat protein